MRSPERARSIFAGSRPGCWGVILALALWGQNQSGAQSNPAQNGGFPTRPAAPASSTLPATQPTSVTAGNALPAPIAATPLATATKARASRRAEVTFSGGLLDVRANGSSLNGILRSVSRLTGMKITGGVAEERVFGNYGPAEPATVLATLLDGTGSNMLLRETASEGPAELVLTPRTGGASPPNPFASMAADPDEAPPPISAGPPPQTVLPPAGQAAGQPGPASVPQPWNNVNGSAANTSPTASTLPVTNSVPTDSIPTPSTTPATAGIVDAPNPPPAGSGLPGDTTSAGTNGTVTSAAGTGAAAGTAASGGVRTPQEIYQQLQQLIKQAQAAQGAGQSSGSPQTPANPPTPPSSTNPQ